MKWCRLPKLPIRWRRFARLTPDGRGSDVVVESVGRPQAWEWAIDMVRKGGTVNFFGGCASGTKVAARHAAAALLRDHAEGDFPPYAGNGAPGVCADHGTQDQGHRLHHGRGAAVAAAAGVAAYVEPNRRDQDGNYSRAVTVELAFRPAVRWPLVCHPELAAARGTAFRPACRQHPRETTTCQTWPTTRKFLPLRAGALCRRNMRFRSRLRRWRRRSEYCAPAGALALREFLGCHLVPSQASAPAFLQHLRLLPHIR